MKKIHRKIISLQARMTDRLIGQIGKISKRHYKGDFKEVIQRWGNAQPYCLKQAMLSKKTAKKAYAARRVISLVKFNYLGNCFQEKTILLEALLGIKVEPVEAFVGTPPAIKPGIFRKYVESSRAGFEYKTITGQLPTQAEAAGTPIVTRDPLIVGIIPECKSITEQCARELQEEQAETKDHLRGLGKFTSKSPIDIFGAPENYKTAPMIDDNALDIDPVFEPDAAVKSLIDANMPIPYGVVTDLAYVSSASVGIMPLRESDLASMQSYPPKTEPTILDGLIPPELFSTKEVSSTPDVPANVYGTVEYKAITEIGGTVTSDRAQMFRDKQLFDNIALGRIKE